jgi:hypothetical protein
MVEIVEKVWAVIAGSCSRLMADLISCDKDENLAAAIIIMIIVMS